MRRLCTNNIHPDIEWVQDLCSFGSPTGLGIEAYHWWRDIECSCKLQKLEELHKMYLCRLCKRQHWQLCSKNMFSSHLDKLGIDQQYSTHIRQCNWYKHKNYSQQCNNQVEWCRYWWNQDNRLIDRPCILNWRCKLCIHWDMLCRKYSRWGWLYLWFHNSWLRRLCIGQRRCKSGSH